MKVWVTPWRSIASITASGSAFWMQTVVPPKAMAGQAKTPAPWAIEVATRCTGGFLIGRWA